MSESVNELNFHVKYLELSTHQLTLEYEVFMKNKVTNISHKNNLPMNEVEE